MRPLGHPLPPSGSLPPLRSLDSLTEQRVLSTVEALFTLYCPLPSTRAFKSKAGVGEPPSADSGYTSGNDDGDADQNANHSEDALAVLRADAFERAFAERWLTGFIGRAEELTCISSEDTRQRVTDKAACVLASFFTSPMDDDDKDGFDAIRSFSFTFTPEPPNAEQVTFEVRLNDGLAGRDNNDCSDVGLQSWGASIVFSELLCASPSLLGLSQRVLGSSPRIVELGAGTGLVSIVLANTMPLLGIGSPALISTDYHAAVLANLRSNIATNFPSHNPLPVEVCSLDWSAPNLTPPLDAVANMLVATDVIYEPKHAVWLRDCASRLLAPDGVFWLLATVRCTGRFEGIIDTVRDAFNKKQDHLPDGNRLALRILAEDRLEKKTGIGRGDESAYRLFKIGWV